MEMLSLYLLVDDIHCSRGIGVLDYSDERDQCLILWNEHGKVIYSNIKPEEDKKLTCIPLH